MIIIRLFISTNRRISLLNDLHNKGTIYSQLWIKYCKCPNIKKKTTTTKRHRRKC